MISTINTAKAIAIISFIFGTILFILHLYFGSFKIVMAGLYYTVFAFLINSLSLISLIILAIINKKHRLELIKTIGLIILNIPVALLYFYLVTAI